MFYILHGPDDFSLKQALNELKKDMGDPTMLLTNTSSFDGRQLTLEQLRVACETVPFLSPARLVIIDGLLARFELANKAGQKKQEKSKPEPRNGHEPFAAYLRQIPVFTTLVMVDGKISARNPLFVALSGKAEVKTFPRIRGARLTQWIERRMKEAGGTASPRAIDLMASLVGDNLWSMSNEIDKLVAFTDGRTIEEKDVRTAVSNTQESNIFELVDAIMELKAGTAERTLEELMRQGAAPAYILTMLSRQTRLIVIAREMMRRKRPKTEIQEKLGLTDYALRRTLEQAEKYSLTRLKEIFHKLLEADLDIKCGKLDNAVVLNILTAEMTQESSHNRTGYK